MKQFHKWLKRRFEHHFKIYSNSQVSEVGGEKDKLILNNR